MADTTVSLGLDDAEYRKGIERAMVGLARLGKQGEATSQTGLKAGKDIGQGLMQAAYFADDLQYGLKGVMNNIPMLASSLGVAAGYAGALSIAVLAAAKAGPYLEKAFTSSADASKMAAYEAEANRIEAERMLAYEKEIAKAIDMANWGMRARTAEAGRTADAFARIEASARNANQTAATITRINREIEDLYDPGPARELARIEEDLAESYRKHAEGLGLANAKLDAYKQNLRDEQAALIEVRNRMDELQGARDDEFKDLEKQGVARVEAARDQIAKQEQAIALMKIEAEGLDQVASAQQRLVRAKDEAAKEAERLRKAEEAATEAAQAQVDAVLAQADAYAKAKEQGAAYAEAIGAVLDGLERQTRLFGNPAARSREEAYAATAKATGLDTKTAATLVDAQDNMAVAEQAYLQTRHAEIAAQREARVQERQGRIAKRVIDRIEEEKGMDEWQKGRLGRIVGDDDSLRRAIEQANKEKLDQLNPALQPVTEATIIKLTTDIQALFGNAGSDGANTYLKRVDEKLKAVVSK